MKVWLQSLAVLLVLGGSASTAHAWQNSKVEYLRPSHQFKAPVIIVDREELTPNGTNDMPTAASEYRSANQSPYVTEFGQSSRPVSLQPPTIRPTAYSPHIQEFGALPLETFGPTFEGGLTNTKPKQLRFSHPAVKRKVSHSSKPQSIAYRIPSPKLLPVHLIPVDELAVFPAPDTRRSR